MPICQHPRASFYADANTEETIITCPSCSARVKVSSHDFDLSPLNRLDYALAKLGNNHECEHPSERTGRYLSEESTRLVRGEITASDLTIVITADCQDCGHSRVVNERHETDEIRINWYREEALRRDQDGDRQEIDAREEQPDNISTITIEDLFSDNLGFHKDVRVNGKFIEKKYHHTPEMGVNPARRIKFEY